nr:ABC transporter substrate-binding protein [Allomuricauda sp.]
MNTVKILLISNTYNPVYARMEEGFLESAKYAFHEIKKEITFGQLDVRLEVLDLKSTAHFLEDVKEKLDDEVLFILGSAQSELTYLLLKEQGLKDYPIISPLATSSFLLDTSKENNQNNFFQTTSSDRERVKLLLGQVIEYYPGKKIYYYYPDAHKLSYPMGLKKDLENALKDNKKVYSKGFEVIFKDNSIQNPLKLPEPGCPVIICAGSQQSSKIAKYLRKKLKRNQIFTFGSNSNLLNYYMIGSVVVCDLDRKSKNFFSREHLKKLLNRNKDPSFTTLIAMNVIFNTLKIKEEQILQTDNNSNLRQSLIDYINNGEFNVENRPFSFWEMGKSTVNDHQLLRISQGYLKPTFGPTKMKGELAPKLSKRLRTLILKAVSYGATILLVLRILWFLLKEYDSWFNLFKNKTP